MYSSCLMSLFITTSGEIDFSWDRTYTKAVDKAILAPGFGDKKYKASVNMATRTTRRLGLNVVPLKVDRNDVRKVINTVWSALEYLETNDPNATFLSHLAMTVLDQRD